VSYETTKDLLMVVYLLAALPVGLAAWCAWRIMAEAPGTSIAAWYGLSLYVLVVVTYGAGFIVLGNA
jgi:hypothetical protein